MTVTAEIFKNVRPKPNGWDDFFSRTSRVPEDFLKDRKDHPPEKRELS